MLFSDDVRSESGRAFGREFRTRIPDARVIYVDPRIAGGMTDEVLKAVDEAQTVIAAVYVIPSAGKMGNTVAMADATGPLLQQLLDRAAQKTAVVAMGNPYLAGDFTKIENYICTFSNATVSELAAVKALFGEIPIRGIFPSPFPMLRIVESGSSALLNSPKEELAMRTSMNLRQQPCDCSAGRNPLFLLPACSLNVKKETERRRKTSRHQNAHGRYPCELRRRIHRKSASPSILAQSRKTKTDGDDKSANVNISSFGLD